MLPCSGAGTSPGHCLLHTQEALLLPSVVGGNSLSTAGKNPAGLENTPHPNWPHLVPQSQEVPHTNTHSLSHSLSLFIPVPQSQDVQHTHTLSSSRSLSLSFSPCLVEKSSRDSHRHNRPDRGSVAPSLGDGPSEAGCTRRADRDQTPCEVKLGGPGQGQCCQGTLYSSDPARDQT